MKKEEAIMWKGKPIELLSKEELIDAVITLINLMESERRIYERQMRLLS